MSMRPVPPAADAIADDVARALAEDVGSGDATVSTSGDNGGKE